jgi:hypothetical protein
LSSFICGAWAALAYLAAESKLVMLDVSDPTSPQLLGSLPMTLATGIQIVGNHAYIADGSAGVSVVALKPFPTGIVASLPTESPATALSASASRLLALAGSWSLL